jgi:TolB-like protein/Tfp pilus assembly protein PilF
MTENAGNEAATPTGALARRKLWQWALAYAAAAWVSLQVLGFLASAYGWPTSTLRIGTGVALTGFPIALVLAWFHGERGAQRVGATEVALIAVLAVAGGIATWQIERRAGSASSVVAAPSVPKADRKSIAVLPFADLSPGHDQEYFSDGMAEELLNALAKVKDLKVAGRTSSFQYRGKSEDLRAIGRALGVATILEGSVRKQGDKVRITAQLVQSEDGFHLWSETFDGDLSDVFALQERIARAITDRLKVVLEGAQQQRLVSAGTSNAEAYALFLQATKVYNSRVDDLSPAADALEQALKLDPAFARAQARLAAVHVVWTGQEAYTKQAEDAARKAIALDPKIAEPWAVLGRSYGEQRRFLEAREAFARALELEPDDAVANYWYGVALIMQGYTREGRARLDRGLVLDPEQPNAELWRGLELSYAGDQEAAQRSVERARDLGLSFAVYGQSEVARAKGEYRQAIDYMSARIRRRMAECGASDAEGARTLEGMYGGDAAARADAARIVERCLARPAEQTQFWAVKALFYLDLPERVLAVAQPRLTNNETFLFEMLWSPFGKSTRRLPAFAEFARRTGLADVWEKYGPPDWCKRRGERDYACE